MSIPQGLCRRHLLKEVKLSGNLWVKWLLLKNSSLANGYHSYPYCKHRGKVILAVMVRYTLANADSMSIPVVIFTHQTLHVLIHISIWLLFDHRNQGYLEGSQYICPFVLCLELWKHDFGADADWILKRLAVAGNMCVVPDMLNLWFQVENCLLFKITLKKFPWRTKYMVDITL